MYYDNYVKIYRVVTDYHKPYLVLTTFSNDEAQTKAEELKDQLDKECVTCKIEVQVAKFLAPGWNQISILHSNN